MCESEGRLDWKTPQVLRNEVGFGLTTRHPASKCGYNMC